MAHNDAAGPGSRQLPLVFGVTEKTQLVCRGGLQRRQRQNLQIGVAMQLAAERLEARPADCLVLEDSEAGVKAAEPLGKNGYKVPLFKGVITEALLAV